MSTQIAVRLPTDLVEEIDALIRVGTVRSRASIVEQALRREIRRQRYQYEIELLATGGASDLDALASHSANVVLDID